MNFLNPLYLFALAAVAVPILIHIFSRRRVPEVPFSTIRFLSRSDRRSMMRINVRRLLLLLMRILAVALVALAFARPVVRGSLAALFPAGGSRAACILLDRSFSMGVEGDSGVAFDRGLARLAAILDNLERGDAVSVVLFDTASEIVYDGEIEKEAVLEALRDARPSWGGTDLRSAAAIGERVLAGSRRDVRELYIISDFQKTAFARSGARAAGNRPAKSPAQPPLLLRRRLPATTSCAGDDPVEQGGSVRDLRRRRCRHMELCAVVVEVGRSFSATAVPWDFTCVETANRRR